MLRNTNSSQEEASPARHLLLVSPEERPPGCTAKAGGALSQEGDLCGNVCRGQTLSLQHVSSRRAGGKQQRLRTSAAAAAAEERKINSASLQ